MSKLRLAPEANLGARTSVIRFLTFVAAAALANGFAGCGGSDETSESSAQDAGYTDAAHERDGSSHRDAAGERDGSPPNGDAGIEQDSSPDDDASSEGDASGEHDASGDLEDAGDDLDALPVNDAAGEADADSFVPVAAETTAPQSVVAGHELGVNCWLRDANGDTRAAPAGVVPQVTFTPPDYVAIDGQGTVTAAHVGQVEALCSFPTLSLTDDTPAVIQILDSTVPTISCDSPLGGSMINVAPGSSITFKGSVQDASGVATVTVNGTPVTLAANAFATSVPARFGVNFIDVVATNTYGTARTKTCTFLAANQWVNPSTSLYNDTVSLKLTQDAFDDINRNNGLNSFDEILYKIANSTGLLTTLDTALKAANPLKPTSCDNQTCTIAGCICWYESGITYVANGVKIDGPNATTLTLVDGGMKATAHIAGVHVNLAVDSKVIGIPSSSKGWADYSDFDVAMTFDVALSSGKPHVALRANTLVTTPGAVSPNFPGVDGWFITNVITPLIQGPLKDALKTQIENYIRNNFNSALDAVISGLNVSTLGSTFNVPKLDGTGSIPVSFGVGFSNSSFTPSRALFGIATKFSAPVANARPTLGVAIPTGTVLNDPTLVSPSNTAVSVHVAIFNQVLHALWRANFFDAALTGAAIGGGSPAAAQATLTSPLPPVANMAPYNSGAPNAVELSLGSMLVDVVYPGLFDAGSPLKAEIGARATTTATLVGNDLKFGSVVINEFKLDTDVALDAATRTTIETFLKKLVERLVDASLNNSLPAMPIPSFPLPASLAPFGLPTGAELGLINPSLSYSPRHFILRGGFGVR
jgi:Glucodextranase, domain B